MCPSMDGLTSIRSKPSFQFPNVGMVYAGPYVLRASSMRKVSQIKTKSVHLELALDLSTEAFLDVLRRFLKQHGRAKNVHSDCGNDCTLSSHIATTGAVKFHTQLITPRGDHDLLKWPIIFYDILFYYLWPMYSLVNYCISRFSRNLRTHVFSVTETLFVYYYYDCYYI